MDDEIQLPHLHSINLLSGDVKISSGNAFSCFLIVQHLKDPGIIQKIAHQMLTAGCRNFVFYGEQEPLWHLGFDDTDILLYPDAETEEIALTSSSNTLEDFIDSLTLELSWYHSEPYDIFLLYDDKVIHERALYMLHNAV